MSEARITIKNKFGSIEVFENNLLINKSFMKQEIELNNIKAIHFQKANMMGGYIRFVVDENVKFDKYGDKNTLLYSKENEDEADRFTSEVANLLGKEKIVIEAPQNDFKIIGTIFGWFISIVLTVMGIALMSEELGMGIFFLLIGVSLIPPVKKVLNSKINALLEKKCSKSWQIKLGTGAIKFCVFFVLFVILAACIPSTTSNTANNAPNHKVTKSQYRNNKNTKMIAEELGLTKDQAAKIYETLVSCGVGNLSSFKLFVDNQGEANSYAVQAYGIPEKILVYVDKDGNVPDIYYDMKPILENGKRVAKIQDYVLTSDEWLDLRVQAQVYIERFLIAPKTAKFHNFKYTINENKIVTVAGTVEAKNAFGVPFEHPFLLQYKKADNGFDLTNGILGNETIK